MTADSISLLTTFSIAFYTRSPPFIGNSSLVPLPLAKTAKYCYSLAVMQASDSSKKHLGIGSVYLPPDCVDDVWKDSPFPLRTRHYHIFFVTGNPGCIEYYHDFLAILSHSLSKAFSSGRVKNQFHVYGHSLANFVHDAGFSSTRPRPILSLREQINFVEENLRAYVQDHKRDEEHTVDKQSKGECNVILVGHSVGTYISLEILSKLKTGRFSVEALQLVGLIALFPTITWIARSPSGLKLGVSLKILSRAFLDNSGDTSDAGAETSTGVLHCKAGRDNFLLLDPYNVTSSTGEGCQDHHRFSR